jgi:hypothetical protein
MRKSDIWSTLLLWIVAAAVPATADSPALTIYNGDFAVVRETIRLDLKPGVNDVSFEGATALAEPNSVVLRDPAGKVQFRILEQSYRADPASTQRLLEAYEGQTIDFWVRDAKDNPIRGKILRAGTKTFDPNEYDDWGNQGRDVQSEPIILIDGTVRMGLPGRPLFPRVPEGMLLKPSFRWRLSAAEAASCQAELAYITHAMTWDADYNVVLDAAGSQWDVVGWVTILNHSGKVFPDARVKLMAGDVRKQKRRSLRSWMGAQDAFSDTGGGVAEPVTERKFDEYHLYTLQHPTTLHDREEKQVEFIRSLGLKVPSQPRYVYDGARLPEDWEEREYRYNDPREEKSSTKVAVYRDVLNRKENGLGIPLPTGTVRFYRRDTSGQIEFIGEDVIAHTPAGETLRLRTGNAFDLVAERRQTNHAKVGATLIRESFEIKLRNRSEKAVEILVVEHLYRGGTWEMQESSQKYSKRDANTIEFKVPVPAGDEKEVTYTVEYVW